MFSPCKISIDSAFEYPNSIEELYSLKNRIIKLGVFN